MVFDWATYLTNLEQGNTNTRPTLTALQSARDAQAAAIKSSYDQNIANYNAQASQLPTAYQGLRNQASEQAAIQQRVLREYLANQGQSGAGGMSLSLQQRNTNNLNNAIGGYNQQQQAALDAINLAKTNLGTQLGADLATNTANYDVQIADMLYNQEQDTYSKAIQMLSAGLITRAQFETMTGIKVNKVTSGAGGGSKTTKVDDSAFWNAIEKPLGSTFTNSVVKASNTSPTLSITDYRTRRGF